MGLRGITTEFYIFADNAIEPNVVLSTHPHHDHPHPRVENRTEKTDKTENRVYPFN
jgi:hypothetical protein